jgi:hypothetical protein
MKREIRIQPLVNYDGVLQPEERERIMNRIQSLFNWIGATIPEDVEIENKNIKLRKLVSDFITKSDVSDDDKENIRILIKALKKKSVELRQIISTQDISDHEAMELLDEITGILRAVDKLRNLTEDDEELIFSGKEDLMRKIDDEKRWLKFTRSMK